METELQERGLPTWRPTPAERDEEPLTFLDWTVAHRLIRDKRTGHMGQFSLADYPWLLEPYQVIGDLPPGFEIVVRKAAQLGWTEWAINLTFYAIDRYGARVFYALPPGLNVVSDFAHDRVSPAISSSPYIRDMAGDIDNVGLKIFRRGAMYLRGTNIPRGRPDKAPQLASVPADVAIIDEWDRVPPAAVPLIHDRLGDSRYKIKVGLSTPTYPGIGIDVEYQKTDQREPRVQCQACGEWHWLNWSLVDYREGAVEAWCRSCQAAIDLVSGWDQKRIVYQPRNLDSDIVGYWVPKLVSPRADLAEMWTRAHSTDVADILAFHNNDLGVGYEPEGARLTLELLRACADDYEMPDIAEWTAMGVDVGIYLTVWIMQPMENGRDRTVYLGEVREWEELDRLMIRYGVHICVVDDQPELREDIAFARRHRGRVFLATYTNNMPGVEWVMFDRRRQRAHIDRTTGLDKSHGDIEAQVDSLPRSFELIGDFVQQMTVNLKTKGLRDDGTVFYHFPRTGRPDHYDHAHVYVKAAMDRLRRLRRIAGGEAEGEGVPVAGERRYRGRM